jgi:hypothetical protein
MKVVENFSRKSASMTSSFSETPEASRFRWRFCEADLFAHFGVGSLRSLEGVLHSWIEVALVLNLARIKIAEEAIWACEALDH